MKAKITFIFSLMFCLYLLVVGKAFYTQVVNKDKLIAYSESQVMRKIKIYPKRGYILDRNENPLAINIRQYNLFTFIKNKKEVKREFKILKRIIPNLNHSKILNQIEKRSKFTWIARSIDLTKKQLTDLKKLKTIQVEPRSSRFYPNHELLAQVLGFVGVDNDGLSGVEYTFNKQLRGKAEIYKYFKDAKGRPIKYKSANIEKRTEDVILSIDKDIQAVVEEELKNAVDEHVADSAGAAVMDAETGEILAMANYPSFDPNHSRNRKNTKISFVSDPFEPGSVFKTLTVASALENNLVTSQTSYYCEKGKFRVGNHYITESDNKHAYEWLSVRDILKYSSNIGTTKIAFDLTYPALKKTLDDFRIGKKSKIQLPGESRGILDKDENISPLRLSNISFGQGVATTGIQMLAAYAPFANGGYYVKPTILKIKDKSAIKRERVVSEKTASQITNMLVSAVEGGTGSMAKVKHFQIAGKTSTAQKPSPNGGYEGYIPGFIGYPVNVKKKFIIFSYVNNPTKNGYYGNAVAAPIFQKITKNMLYKNKKFNQLSNLKIANHKTLDNIHIKYSASRKITKGFIPNLIGLDKGSSFKILDSLKINYNHKGFGIVTSQTPEAGSALTKNTIVKLKFSAPSYD